METPQTLSKSLTWLHLSDIHFSPRTDWRDSSSRSSLLSYLTDIFAADDDLRPDLIFCTGDIAFGEIKEAGLSKQYDQAKQFFDELLRICGRNGKPLPKNKLFVVPGNHDINRRTINRDAQSNLQAWAQSSNEHADTINQRFDSKSIEFKDAIKRLDEYAAFVAAYLPHQTDKGGRVHYTWHTTIRDIKVGIAGFNSAWSCSGPEDDRNIWLAANWQFNNAAAGLKDTDLRIGLIHHPIDWLNIADRNVSTRRVASDFHFWLHGHTHDAWVTPTQSHTVIAAGAVGAQTDEEFGVNITCVYLGTGRAITHLHHTKASSNGWTIAPIPVHAPTGLWAYNVSESLRAKVPAAVLLTEHGENVDEILTARFEQSLASFHSLPKMWLHPTLSRVSEIAKGAKSQPKVDIRQLLSNPMSTIIYAPPQYGLTCLARYLAVEAWRAKEGNLWIYLDAAKIRSFKASITGAISDELASVKCSESEISCVILDSWSSQDKEAQKVLKFLNDNFPTIPIICMQQINGDLLGPVESENLPRPFETLYLWALPRERIRQMVAACNEIKPIGDEDAVTSRISTDLVVLNLHRTPLNCLTLLKASEVDFDESPVNRTEMIKRVLFVLFNIDSIPTYKSRPDLKDCEYVLGYFCELLIREGVYVFTREKFLTDLKQYCAERLLELDTHVVFDVLYNNSILVPFGNAFRFKFSYWIFYFAAWRMHHDKSFAAFILQDMRYASFPEIIEFYTGIDRGREDALQTLLSDLQRACSAVSAKCGFPEDLNPYRNLAWKPSPDTQERMQRELSDGIRDSKLPVAIKDQYADKAYDPGRPYDQSVRKFLSENSFHTMFQGMRAASRALRNSDYAAPEIKRALLSEILKCWDEATKVLLTVLPLLAKDGHAMYDGTGFSLMDDFGATPNERVWRILESIPGNIVGWCEDDLFSRKMGALFFDQLNNSEISAISRHELILLLIHQRPRDWHKYVYRYVADVQKNSFYLRDVYACLQTQYRYGFADPNTLKEMKHLIEMAITKHVTGNKEPGTQTIQKTVKRLSESPVPDRDAN